MTTTVLAYIPSPPQGVWHLGFLPIRAYALCIITGIIAALIIGDRRWVARGGQAGVIYDIALWAVPFGLIGGRLYHVMTDWPTYFGDNGAGFLAALRIWDGGLGIWGAVALGGVGAWIACKRRGIPLPAFGDAIAPGIVLAQAIGRLGNYFNQELYGRVTTLPWGLEIFERRDASGALDTLNGVSTGVQIAVVHPTFLYELLWNLLVFAFLIVVDRRFKIGHGRLFALYVAAYCVGRFWIELMRSDHATDFGGIRVNSFTSTFVFIAAVIYVMVATKGREDPASLAGNDLNFDAEGSLLDEIGEDVAAAAATSGLVSAVVVAEKDDANEKAVGAEKDTVGEAKTVEAAKSKADETNQAPEESNGREDTELPEESNPETDETEGLGSVEGDEVADAVSAAPEVHEASVEEAGDAKDLEAKVAVEPEAIEPEALEPEAVEPESVKPEAVKPAADEAEGEAEGVGSVEGDEIADAVAAAPKIHAAATKGAAEAEALEEEVDAEAKDGEDAKDGETT